MKRQAERTERMAKILRYLKKAYPQPKSELEYTHDYEFLYAVLMSAQCTDKRVNMVNKVLFKKYTTLQMFANAKLSELRKDIGSISFPNNKAKHMIQTAQLLIQNFGGKVPRTIPELLTLKGVARKTANVVRGELYNEWDGIAIDTHVKRFARKFDLSDATTADGLEKDFMALVPKKDWQYVNNGLVLYGRYVCKATKHDCAQHPLTKIWPPAQDRWPKAW